MRLIIFCALALLTMIVSTNDAYAQATTDTALVYDSTTVAKVKVKGITCAMDLKMISANVEKLQGVDKCETAKEGPTTTFEVKYNPVLVTEKEIYAAIEGTGSCENPDERPYKVKQ